MARSLPILYEDNHLLAVNKPAGLATMGVEEGTPSAVAWAKSYLKRQYKKPGNVYLGIVSRLDAWVSGVLVFARTSKAAARLTEQFKLGRVEKAYWALVEQVPHPPAGEWTDWLAKDEEAQRIRVVPAGQREAQEARLRYRHLRAAADAQLVEIDLLTGRKHQIRIQFASRGLPILGDRKYGSRAPFPAGIALHARRLVIDHPTRREPVEIVAPLPPAWQRWLPVDPTR